MAALAFILGFFINEVARGDAYLTAYENAQEIILNNLQTATSAGAEANHARAEAAQAAESLKAVDSGSKQVYKDLISLKGKAELIVTSLESTGAYNNTSESIADMANVLAKTPGFSEEIGQALDADVKSLTDRISRLEARLEKISSGLSRYIQYGAQLQLKSENGYLNPRGGSRAEKQVTLSREPTPGWEAVRQ